MSPILVKTPAAAAILGVSVSTLLSWAQTVPEIRACRMRRGWWRVAALEQLGVIK